MRVRAVHLPLLALAVLLAGCTWGSLASQRYTYIVKYSVTSTEAVPTAVTGQYLDESRIGQAFAGPPWSIELPARNYDYSDPYYPTLTASSATPPAAGEQIAVTIILRDYRTGFIEETLTRQVFTGDGSALLAVALTAPELPLTR